MQMGIYETSLPRELSLDRILDLSSCTPGVLGAGAGGSSVTTAGSGVLV